MAAAAEHKLSLDEFHARYSGEKPYYEFWDGEAVQKSMPTGLHSLVQRLLLVMLNSLGYQAGAEVTLKLDPAYEPIPDVIALNGPLPLLYPTEPFEVVIEILSPDDTLSRIVRKCRMYEKWGIRQIVVIDPRDRSVLVFERGVLSETGIIARRGEKAIDAKQLWDEVDRLLNPKASQ